MTTDFFHIESLSPLYEAVQTAGIFPDSKFFVDCTCRTAPEQILVAYAREKDQPGFDLKAFVAVHFEFPETPDTAYRSADLPLAVHLDKLWLVLERKPAPEPEDNTNLPPSGTLIPLPNAYVVPGGRFREVYYWDSYFTMLGLQVSGKETLIRDMVDNFAYLIDTVGFVPNGNRTYYLSRSQPPFFALMLRLLSEIDGADTLLHYRPQLEKEYNFWMAGAAGLSAPGAERRVVCLPGGDLMNRYWDDRPEPRPEAYREDLALAQASGRAAELVYRDLRAAAESGWDFSSRWLANGHRLASIETTDLVPVDLNCLLYFMEKTLLQIYRQLPDRAPADLFKERAKRRKAAIQTWCWNETEGFFFDYHHRDQRSSQAWTLAGAFPLYFQIATPEQAARIAQHLEEKFLQPGGLLTTLQETGQQWDAPNGWAPLQYIVCKGLMDYGFDELAGRIRRNWRAINEKTYADTGKMMEKYNVVDIQQPGGGGEYPNQDGFGWSNGVYLALPYLCPPNSLKA